MRINSTELNQIEMILKGLMLRHSLLFLLKRILLVCVYLNVQGVGISTLPKGSCIGPSFQLQLMRAAPERFAAAVLLQPIGKRYLTFLFVQGLMDFLFVLPGRILPNTKQFFFPLLVASLTNQYFMQCDSKRFCFHCPMSNQCPIFSRPIVYGLELANHPTFKMANKNWVVKLQICFTFTPKIVEDEPIIVFKGVGSTTN